jgi:metallo-beta-lactamase family protein
MSSILTHLGGLRTVTGSCHLLQARGLNIMVDCGLAQGNDDVAPMETWSVPPSRIDYLFLTHAHIDHIGRVPELVQKGFRGQIILTHATKALIRPMFRDALNFLNITERQAAKLLETIDELSWGFEYDQSFDLKSGIRFKFGRTGHILGSCFIRFEIPNNSSQIASFVLKFPIIPPKSQI